MEKMKNISEKEVLTLREQVAYQPGQVVSRTLAQNSAVSHGADPTSPIPKAGAVTWVTITAQIATVFTRSTA